eukprot:scaffold67542_cov63-Phaeocystis_antarctica.AAC.8
MAVVGVCLACSHCEIPSRYPCVATRCCKMISSCCQSTSTCAIARASCTRPRAARHRVPMGSRLVQATPLGSSRCQPAPRAGRLARHLPASPQKFGRANTERNLRLGTSCSSIGCQGVCDG